MSAPRWTLDLSGRMLCYDGEPTLYLAQAILGPQPIIVETIRPRIVALLNTTELTTDAAVTLQYACMSTAAHERELADAAPAEGSDVARERNQRIGTLDGLALILDHVARVYVELTEEAAMELQAIEGKD